MKALHLLRHAKSDRSKPWLGDRERGLNKRGRRDAPRMGEALAGRPVPVTIYVSPARRAQLTLEGICTGWPALADARHCTDEDLYTFDVEELLGWLAARPDSENAVFLIGHNPALTDLVNELVGEYCLDNLPTAGYVELRLPIDRWRDLLRCEAVIEYRLFPRALPRS